SVARRPRSCQVAGQLPGVARATQTFPQRTRLAAHACQTTRAVCVYVRPESRLPRRWGGSGVVRVPRVPGIHGWTEARRTAPDIISARMKQVLQYHRSGTTRVVDVPAPTTPSGGVLVHNRWA